MSPTPLSAHQFNKAAILYGQAIDCNPKDATLWCNRAYTRIKLEEHGYGLADATTAIELDPKYAKAYYRCVLLAAVIWIRLTSVNRRATCYLQTLKYKQAIADFKKLLSLEPQNQLVRTQMESTQKILRKAEFEKVRPLAMRLTRPPCSRTRVEGHRNGRGEERCGTVYGDHS